MQSIQIEDDYYFSRVPSIRGRRSSSGTFSISPSLLIGGLPRKSFSYNKLPQQSITLSILKLNGSCFDVEVTSTASIDELKVAVERIFSHFPRKGPGKISWSYVWSQFCLCYDGQKLLIGTDSIRNYGIKDGDQLYFARHVSIKYKLIKKRSSKPPTYMQLSNIDNEKKTCTEENVDDDDYEDLENPKSGGYFEVERDGKLLMQGKMFEEMSHSSRLVDGFMSALRKIIRIYSDKCCS